MQEYKSNVNFTVGHKQSVKKQMIFSFSNNESVFLRNYTFLLTLLSCFFCNGGSGILSLLVIMAFAPLIFWPEHLLGPILFFSVFDDFLLIAEGISCNRFLTIFFIVGVVFFIFQHGTIKVMTFSLMGFIFMGIFLSQFSVMGYTSLPVTYVLNLILAIAMINFKPSGAEKVLRQIYVYAVLSLIFVVYLLGVNGLDSIVDGVRMTIDKGVNSNQLAMGLAVVMAVLACDLMYSRKGILMNAILLVVNCIVLFMTGSRSALIAGIATSCLVVVISSKEKGKRSKAIFFSLFAAFVLYMVYVYLQEQFPLLMERFTIENVKESGGTGRTNVWRAFFRDWFPNYWAFGIGFDPLNLFYAVKLSNKIGHGAHNIVVELLSKVGVIGGAFYVFGFFKYVCEMFKNILKKPCLIYSLAIVFALVIDGIGEDVLGTRFLWFGLGLGYMILNNTDQSVKVI